MSVSWALVETVDCLLMQIIRFELANVVFDQWTSFDALSAHGKRTRNDDKLLRLSTQNEWLTCGLFCTTHKIMCLFYSSGSTCCSMSTIFSYQQTNSAKRAHTFCCFSFFMSQQLSPHHFFGLFFFSIFNNFFCLIVQNSFSLNVFFRHKMIFFFSFIFQICFAIYFTFSRKFTLRFFSLDIFQK